MELTVVPLHRRIFGGFKIDARFFEYQTLKSIKLVEYWCLDASVVLPLSRHFFKQPQNAETEWNQKHFSHLRHTF
jgi:hypothetical protein